MIRELEALITVAETGSVGAAAIKLSRTQSALTRQIQRLELDLGTAVLDRSVKPPRLTAVGARILSQSRQILSALDMLKAHARPDEEPTGVFRLGISNALPERAIIKGILRLRACHPRLSLKVTSDWSPHLIAATATAALDAAVVLDGPSLQRSKLPQRPLLSEPLCIIVNQGIGLPQRIEKLDDLSEQNWIMKPEGCGARALLMRAFSARGMAPNIVADVQSDELQLALVAKGLGIALVPKRYVHGKAKEARLGTVKVKDFAPSLAICIVHSDALGLLQRAVQTFAETLRSESVRKR